MACLNQTILLKVLEQPFRLSNPVLHIPDFCWSQTDRVQFAKAFIQKNVASIELITDIAAIHGSSPIVTTISDIDSLNYVLDVIKTKGLGRTNNKVIIILTNNLTVRLHDLGSDIKIDQEIFFFNTDSMTISEDYKVGDTIVTNEVGRYHKDAGNRLVDFKLTASSLKLAKRRNNFHRQHIVGMTDQFIGLLIMKPGFEQGARYFESNQTYEVTHWVEGIYLEFWNVIAKSLNFTYTLYKRKDSVWAGLDDNGLPTGMMSNLVEGSADVIVQALEMNTIRAPFLKYAPFTTIDYMSIFIRRKQSESLEWNTFFQPFKLELWMSIGCMSVLTGTWLFLGNHHDEIVSCLK